MPINERIRGRLQRKNAVIGMSRAVRMRRLWPPLWRAMN